MFRYVSIGKNKYLINSSILLHKKTNMHPIIRLPKPKVQLPVKVHLLPPPKNTVPSIPIQKRDESPPRKSTPAPEKKAPQHTRVNKVVIKKANCSEQDKYHLRQLANPCDEEARFVAIVIQGDDWEKITEIHFGNVKEVYLADAGSDAIFYHACLIGKTDEEKQCDSIEQDEKRRFRSKWLTCWLLKHNRDISHAAEEMGEYLGCKVKIKDEVYDALGHLPPDRGGR